MEGLFLLKEIIIPRDQMCEIDLKDAYFTISSKEISETRQISMDVQAVPVSLFIIRSVFSTMDFYKVNEIESLF